MSFGLTPSPSAARSSRVGTAAYTADQQRKAQHKQQDALKARRRRTRSRPRAEQNAATLPTSNRPTTAAAAPARCPLGAGDTLGATPCWAPARSR
jgi:hypothetical protein